LGDDLGVVPTDPHTLQSRTAQNISALVTHQLAREMDKLDIPPIPDFVEMISDSGAVAVHGVG
jgi:hypothetical protein